MTRNKRTYTLVAGVNGAGKSTLFRIFPERFKQTERINTDEILRQNHGDWRSAKDNALAGKQTIKQLQYCIDHQIAFHQETTLSGNVKGFLRRIQTAKDRGFEVHLIYVALDSPEKAIQRVANRVEKGGHGIPEDLITKRYFKSLVNLKEIVAHVDGFELYDNNSKMTQVKNRNETQFNLKGWLANHTANNRAEN
ncbi:zeta toxin family protein [Aerococcaceae bacterium 50-4]